MRMDNLRLAFKFGSWCPTQSEWMLAAQCVQPEEKARIARFVFRKDAMSAMVGRLLLRKGICYGLDIPYDQIKMGRTEKNKPIIENKPINSNFSMNLSHQGDYAVLATSGRCEIGVDVMPVDNSRPSKTVDEYLQMMKKEFTDQEYSIMTAPEKDEDKLAIFYRFWCLKESYVKALGIGIGFTLRRIDFRLKTMTLKENEIVADTQVYLDGKLETSWLFHETMLDSTHCVAVAFHQTDKSDAGLNEEQKVPFKVLSFAELTDCAKCLSEPDVQYWENFSKKTDKKTRKS